MESLSIVLSSSPLLQNNHPKTYKSHTSKPISLHPNQFFNINTSHKHFPSKQNPLLSLKNSSSHPQINHVKSLSSYILLTDLLFNCFPCLAASSETVVEQQVASDKINLEAILVSIDEFFNRYPFFVAGVTFIWLVVIPLTQNYMKKYKFTSAIDAFRKLRDDPNSMLLDIRDKKSLAYLGSPNLKILNKSVVQVQFDERDDDGQGFVNKVLEKIPDPANTVICVLDNFDGNSIKVAELFVKNGFKEAYAIRGGVRGKDGWQAIQETLLPPSVHMYPRKKGEASQQLEVNGAFNQQSEDNYVDRSHGTNNGYVKKSIKSDPQAKLHSISLSPYPHYPDLKPPSSPTPAKPKP